MLTIVWGTDDDSVIMLFDYELVHKANNVTQPFITTV